MEKKKAFNEVRMTRLPDDLYKKLKTGAIENSRTIGKHAEFICKQFFKIKAK